jgi:UMF1 family MFS transporter
MSQIKTSKVNVFLWSTYDIANTIFSMGIVSMTILQYSTLLGMQSGFSYFWANLFGGIATFLSNIIVAITIPIMGSISDRTGEGKPGTIVFGALTILFTGIIFLFQNVFIGLIFFILANIVYQWGNLFYDTMIPRIASKEGIGKVSAFGVAIGYFGSVIGIALNFVAIAIFGNPTTICDDGTIVEATSRIEGYTACSANPKLDSSQIDIANLSHMFWLSAIGFLLIALPFLLTKEHSSKTSEKTEKLTLNETIKGSFSETIETGKEIWNYPDMKWFIIGWLLTVDVVNTVIAIMKKAAVEGFAMNEAKATLLLLAGVMAAIFLTWFSGPMCDKKGPKVTFMWIGFIWVITLLIPLFVESADGSDLPKIFTFLPESALYVMALLAGFGMGSTWVAGRSMTIELAPEGKLGSYFGFSRLASKGTSAFGILIFTATVSITNAMFGSLVVAYKISIFVLLIIYLVGLYFLYKVEDHHQKFVDGERAPYSRSEE